MILLILGVIWTVLSFYIVTFAPYGFRYTKLSFIGKLVCLPSMLLDAFGVIAEMLLDKIIYKKE